MHLHKLTRGKNKSMLVIHGVGEDEGKKLILGGRLMSGGMAIRYSLPSDLRVTVTDIKRAGL